MNIQKNTKQILFFLFICTITFAQNSTSKKQKESCSCCKTCSGKGSIEAITVIQEVTKCSSCLGKGGIKCSHCNGNGRILRSRKKKRRFLGIKVGSKTIRWYESCSHCRGRGIKDCNNKCTAGYFYKDKKITNQIPCTNPKCPGPEQMKLQQLKFNQMFTNFQNRINRQKKKFSNLEKDQKASYKILRVLSLEAVDAIIHKEFDDFIKTWGKEDLMQLLGREAFENLEKINNMIKNLSVEERKKIISNLKKT